uniref:NADH-ubiquinone oxidoreductase chain 1 n=2 Tax=Monochamus alternatus TaxID=192382 RepID=K9Y628_MONAT|nr:NADH dehydrogenase subunit 1 [Monochamus alternatus]YP_009913604.1 NADH dehydrogenase subunit 1 [Monochamus alternatus alternatus]AFZ40844.1 NADH dehydrogenase subunit 1 [Monochamus alternatus]AIG22819.1 NADH dehydrogenase subunit 1 [Monochamus alternatus]QLM01490.1 NADH dehydrogenase subunit 1 [Monochamus alternatus alternatus]QWM97284.1 NADH dehydrogenase subunit 1 [Monochamus alternatus]
MLLDLILVFVSILILVICVLVGVAFLTLLERKVLGYIQIRKGPNKVGFIGLIQPFSDAIKLFTKEQTFPYMSNFNLYYFSPMMNLFLALILWICMPFFSMNISFNLSILYFLSISSLSVYTVMLAGWSSNSNYSLLGSLRAVAQTISYEVSLALILMSFLYLILSLNILDLMKYQKYIWFIVLMLPLCFMWLVSSLAETNRTPFDFAEGESELVSGFNVEYSSGGFAMIFLAEYASILFMSFMCCMLFMGGDLMSFNFFMKIGFFSFLWIWVRGTLPRYRYDKLMYLAWKGYLPISLNYLLLFLSMKIFIFILLT